MNQFRNLLVLFAVWLVGPGYLVPCHGAPVVTGMTGTATKGGSITIIGSGFGTKQSARPIVWDDFESGEVGITIHGKAPVVGPLWETYVSAGCPRPTYTNAIVRSGSTRSSLHDFTSVSGYNSSLEVETVQPKYYFSFWYHYSLTAPPWSRNVKPWVMYGSLVDQPIAYCGWGDPSAGDGGLRSGIIDNGESVNLPTMWASGNDLSEDQGRWIRIEGYLVQSTVGQHDGVYQMWIHKPHGSVSLTMSDTTAVTRVTAASWCQLQIGSYDGTGASRVFVDDVYVDSTQARVELGDKPQWAACTWREIQIPTAWSDSSVTFTFNPGQFGTADAAYLYVVDASGTANTSGLSVTIGGGATPPDSLPPAAPTGLRIVQP